KDERIDLDTVRVLRHAADARALDGDDAVRERGMQGEDAGRESAVGDRIERSAAPARHEVVDSERAAALVDVIVAGERGRDVARGELGNDLVENQLGPAVRVRP